MSLILYINDMLMELEPGQDVALTRQVNDLANLANRQANRSNRIKIPKTAGNIRKMDRVSLVGSTSNFPYQHNTARLFDENGLCLTYDGWAIVTDADDDYYDVLVYEGAKDFYKFIENKTLTEIGINDLNHLKNLANVIDTFTNDTLPYKYIVADYNGLAVSNGKLNIDYLVPSARKSYVFDRIHQFAGFTYSGSTFQTEAFLNWFVTYPKPVPTLDPITIPITTQNSVIQDIPQTYSTGSGLFYGSIYLGLIFPSNFDTALANNNNGYTLIKQTGAYRVTCSGTFSNNQSQADPAINGGIINWYLRDSANVLISQGEIDASINQTVVIPATIGNRLYLTPALQGQNAPGNYNPLTGSVNTILELLEGYDANFDLVLMEFKAKDFIAEVLNHFALTPFKDPYSNHIEYLTLHEILQGPTLDWSGKFISKISESYSLLGYAQRNHFKYKYNGEGETHRDGFIPVANVNLDDETTAFQSRLYAPEKNKRQIIFQNVNVYPIWSKQVKDDGTVEYKDLSGRFYSMRYDVRPFAVEITSVSLNTTDNITHAPFENDYRLNWQQVIYDHYTPIESILDKAKVLPCYFNLTPLDIVTFDFKNLIYVEQLGSYYQVNKIHNFIKGKDTKCDLIKVDYFKELPASVISNFIEIASATLNECTVTFTLNTNIEQPFQVQIIPYGYMMIGFASYGWAPFPTSAAITGTVVDNQVSFVADMLPYSPFGYQFMVTYTDEVWNSVSSQLSEAVIITEGCYDEPDIDTTCAPGLVSITSVTRTNAGFPQPTDQGSLWSIQYSLEGLTPEAVCTPYGLRAEVNTSIGLQIYTNPNIIAPPGSFAFNLAHRPASASVRLVFINPDGAEFPSPFFNYP